jgi:hypothetical protein
VPSGEPYAAPGTLILEKCAAFRQDVASSGHCQPFLLKVEMKALRVMLNSSGVSLLARQDKAVEDLLAMRPVDAAGEAVQVAAQMAKESVSRRTSWWRAADAANALASTGRPRRGGVRL